MDNVTADSLTDAQITKLRAEAAAHGDAVIVECCDLAQGKGESGGPHTVRGARVMCADAINAARAQAA